MQIHRKGDTRDDDLRVMNSHASDYCHVGMIRGLRDIDSLFPRIITSRYWDSGIRKPVFSQFPWNTLSSVSIPGCFSLSRLCGSAANVEEMKRKKRKKKLSPRDKGFWKRSEWSFLNEDRFHRAAVIGVVYRKISKYDKGAASKQNAERSYRFTIAILSEKGWNGIRICVRSELSRNV